MSSPRCVEELDVGHGARVARLADLDHDAHAVRRKFAAELPVAHRWRSAASWPRADRGSRARRAGRRNRWPADRSATCSATAARSTPKAPAAVETQPAIAALAAALDRLDPLHRRAVEQDGLIDLVARQRVGGAAPDRAARRAARRVAIGQDDVGSRVGDLAAVRQRAAQLDRHDELPCRADGLARPDARPSPARWSPRITPLNSRKSSTPAHDQPRVAVELPPRPSIPG